MYDKFILALESINTHSCTSCVEWAFFLFNIEIPPTIPARHTATMFFWRLFFHSAVRVTLNLYNIHPFPQSPIPFRRFESTIQKVFLEKKRRGCSRRTKKNMWVEEEEENPNPKTSSLFGG